MTCARDDLRRRRGIHRRGQMRELAARPDVAEFLLERQREEFLRRLGNAYYGGAVGLYRLPADVFGESESAIIGRALNSAGPGDFVRIQVEP